MSSVTVTADQAKLIQAIACFAGTKDIRYYLNGVCFEQRSGVLRIVATDGTVAGVAVLQRDREGDDFSVIVPNELLKLLSKVKGAYTLELGEKIVACYGCQESSCLAIDGTFPDWRRVMVCSTNAQEVAHYNPEYLDKIKMAAGKLKVALYNFTQHGTNAGNFTIGDKICGVLMPMRIAEADKSVFDSILN